jgi:hypothetical protein
MSKKMRLNLGALTVKSFITDLENDEQKAIKGGTPAPSWPPLCPSGQNDCRTSPIYCPSYAAACKSVQTDCYTVCFSLQIPCTIIVKKEDIT